MYIVTFLLIFNITLSISILAYKKSNLDKSSVLNKGIWLRNKAEASAFIFPANSLDLDVFQNNFDAFEENNAQSPFSPTYINRSKRSPSYKPKSESGQEECKNKLNCHKVKSSMKSSHSPSKFIPTLKPASAFNDYHFEIAALPGLSSDEYPDTERAKFKNNKDNLNNIKHIITLKTDASIVKNLTDTLNKNQSLEHDLRVNFNISINSANKTVTIPKRSMNKKDFENELVKKIEFIEEFNNTDNVTAKKDRNVFDKEDMAWHNTAPLSNVNIYKVVPKFKENAKNRINERGLIKVLSMLAKTFKKIMKQHSDIKQIHKRLYSLNDEFVNNIAMLTNKFEIFNKKYTEMMKVSQELYQMEEKLRDKELSFDKRERELSKNLLEFQNQQKKFLAQQRQFYNVQRLMLEQNEKINLKQNTIAKTQSEISHRQNNFARILKKAKQIYMSSKNVETSTIKYKNPPDLNTEVETGPFTTESVKINLFSVPTEVNQLKDQDHLLLGEKDYQPVDDLIYKYYFNNTFIDDIMKNKILTSFMASESTYNNNTKNKRNQIKLKSTILLPVNNTKNNVRHRRWIKSIRRHKKDAKTTKAPKLVAKVESKVDSEVVNKNDPFKTMSINFCKEIGQNTSVQILNWCIEKTMRRLHMIGLRMPPVLNNNDVSKQQNKNSTFQREADRSLTTEMTTSAPTSSEPLKMSTTQTSNIFFPDNDELEDKLKEYELRPDPEGTVYYDGSLHSSDLGRIVKQDSEGFSDIMPGLDSDSRVDVDPFTIDLQAQRRAEVRKINARVLRMRMG